MMGLIKYIRSKLDAAEYRATAEAAEYELRASTLAHQASLIQEASKEADTSYGANWRLSGGGLAGNVFGRESEEIKENDFYTMLETSMNMYLYNETYRGVILQITRFVVGKGAKLSAEMELDRDADKPTESQRAAAERSNNYWIAFAKANGLGRKDKEIFRRMLRDGDVLLSFANEGMDGWHFVEADIDGKAVVVPKFKFLDVYRIQDSEGKALYGIVGDDPEEPGAYLYQMENASLPIPAELIFRFKDPLADSTWLRGLPRLLASYGTCRKRARFCDAALNRIELSNCLILHAKYDNMGAAATARTANLKIDTDNSNVQKRFKPGTMLRSGNGVEYGFLTPQMEGARAQDGRLFDLQIARVAGLTEYHVSADASAYKNRSTADVVSDPAVRSFEEDQDSLGDNFKCLAEAVIAWGKTYSGYLQPDDPSTFEIEFPPLISRDDLVQAQALDLDTQHGLSDRTYLEKRGYDFEQEHRRKGSQADENYSDEREADDNEDSRGRVPRQPDQR